jgi:hypothetical protein
VHFADSKGEIATDDVVAWKEHVDSKAAADAPKQGATEPDEKEHAQDSDAEKTQSRPVYKRKADRRQETQQHVETPPVVKKSLGG